MGTKYIVSEAVEYEGDYTYKYNQINMYCMELDRIYMWCKCLPPGFGVDVGVDGSDFEIVCGDVVMVS